MLNVIVTGVSYLFPGGRVVKLLKDGINITNLTNPILLTKNITLTVLDCCAPPPVQLAANCIAASVGSPNSVTIGSAIHFISEIYENC